MLIQADAVAQRRSVCSTCQTHATRCLGIGPTILRSLRDLGYRDSAAAICALVDNAINAQASKVDILLASEDGTVTAIALFDNGFGMVPEMMRAACAVGASCPLGDGPHLAPSGFGLPFAPFAIGRRFELISSPTGATPARVLFDLDDLTSEDVLIPQAVRAEFPLFVHDHLRREGRAWSGGTIVVLSELDRLSPRIPLNLAQLLRARLGQVFGRFLDRITLTVDGMTVAPIDPLFLFADAPDAAPGMVAAVDAGTLHIAVGGGEVTIRTALLSPGFPGPDRCLSHRVQMSRAAIVRDNHGFVISRLGRRLTLLPSLPWFQFSGADRAIRVKIDFPPSLDDLFAPSLSLQQVQVNAIVWDALRAGGLASHLDALRRRAAAERKSWRERVKAMQAAA